MATRLVQTFVPDTAVEKLDALLEEMPHAKAFRHNLPGATTQYHILIPAEEVSTVLDPLQSAFSSYDDFRAVVLAVETVVPKVLEPKPSPEAVAAQETKKRKKGKAISREELIDDLEAVAKMDSVHLWMVALSTVVATIGLATDNVAVLIGAMVIAPLLGPNMALALATTLGDTDLAKLSLRTSCIGVTLAFVLAAAAGWIFDLNLESHEIMSRTSLNLQDLLLALAAGAAGALAFTTGVPASLVGVMVAVALLPPLVVCALAASNGHWGMAQGAGMLLAGNLVCVNLAGVATFLLRGVAPRTWWQKRKSRKLAVGMLLVWLFLLAALVVLVLLVAEK
ncbi:MAG: TIGR00341 family protein [Planctomycetota bacterium]